MDIEVILDRARNVRNRIEVVADELTEIEEHDFVTELDRAIFILDHDVILKLENELNDRNK